MKKSLKWRRSFYESNEGGSADKVAFEMEDIKAMEIEAKLIGQTTNGTCNVSIKTLHVE